jgi:uncharacterized protein (DUF1800 family)
MSTATSVSPSDTSSLLDPDPALHLARRATFGATAQLVAAIRGRGTTAWLEEQLEPASVSDAAVSTFLGRYMTLGYSEARLASLTSASQRQQAMTELIEATLVRQIWSTRQLFEVMVDFWSNHFNVLGLLSRELTAKPVEDREVIRRHALGRFEDMLLADANSAAMLLYLSNDSSRLDRPNENYGRELLELHTVGVGAGYTETDVLNSAYVLTGRTCDANGLSYYRPEWHYVGPVRVLDWSSPNSSTAGGFAVGDSYLRYLARHPSTAQALSRKLAIRFVSDDPPASLVTKLAEVYLSSGTSIVACLRALFTSVEFADSVGQKTKRPLEDLVGCIRAMGIGLPLGNNKSAISDLRLQSAYLDNLPFGCAPPSGYPDVAIGWRSIGGTLGRWNMHQSLVTGKPVGLNYPALGRLLDGPPMATHGEVVDRLTTVLTGQVFRADDRQALLTAVGMTEGEAYNQRKVDRSLITLITLILDSGYLLLK